MRKVISCAVAALAALLVMLPAAPGAWRCAAQEEETAAESNGGDEAEPAGDASGEQAADEEGEEVPEGVRRSRPRTEEQERQYKQRKTREDPFLNPQIAEGPAAGDSQFYDPAEWLSADVQPGISSYLVQDAGGAVVGQLVCSVEVILDPVLGEFVQLRLRSDYERPQQTDLWLYGETLKPRRKEVVTELPTASRPPPPAVSDDSGADVVEVLPLYHDTQRLDVDYLFDRLVIRHRAGEVTATRRLRMMPFSYDIDELLILPRQLKFREAAWPFEALICDPATETHLALYIEAPQRVDDVLAADASYTDCHELTVRLGEHRRSYWVQRLPPHRLVKFTDGVYTYTLAAYLEQS